MKNIIKPIKNIESVVVSAEQMQRIESQIFAKGMPIPALMEKAAILTANRIEKLYSPCSVGVLVGPGHNGGDALVIARELHLQGYQVTIYCAFSQLKELTSQHLNYAKSLDISLVENIEFLSESELIIDGLFGFGLTRNLEGEIASAINLVNQWKKPIISIDIPSGIHTDTGEVLGTAICATYSLCLGLWKLAYFQDQALPYLGQVERIDIGIPPQYIWSNCFNQGDISLLHPHSQGSKYQGTIQILTKTMAQQFLPLPRPLVTHKYQQGHLLLICGSNRYAGGAILTALGARSSGVGMLSIAVPKTLKPLLVSHLPEALIIECPETETGAIAKLPELNLNQYDVIACGPGLTLDAEKLVESVLQVTIPLILDADALNIVAKNNNIALVKNRTATTVLTPHLGEFKRLFPTISHPEKDRISAVIKATEKSNTIVLLKGSRTAIADQAQIYLIPESTPALARGGSGDTLTGLIGGLMAQKRQSTDTFTGVVATGAWWHAQAAILAASERTDLGVDAYTLSQYLWKVAVQLMLKSSQHYL